MNLLILVLLAGPPQQTAKPEDRREEQIRRTIERIEKSGRVLTIAKPSERTGPPPPLAPGAPPLLSFRYFEGKDRHRFGKLDLVMDDAGH